MKTHLSHQLPWDSLVKNYYRNYSEGLIFPICECKKMHIIKKSDEIKAGNRKYIKEEQICRDPSCKEIGEDVFYKNKNKIKWEMDTIDVEYSYYHKTYRTKMNIAHFVKEHSKAVNNFADDYLNKLKKIRTDKKFKLDAKYNKENIDNYLTQKTKEYNDCGSDSDYEYIYALTSSGDDNDIIFLLNEIDKYKKDNTKGLCLVNVVTEWGTQCFGRYANYIMDSMNRFYLTVNAIIASGNFNNRETWEKTGLRGGICVYGDFHSFVPNWIDEHFYKDKLENFNKDYNNELNINFFDCIKTEKLYDLLKKIFRYNYIWLALYKYADEKKLREYFRSIFLRIVDFGYIDDDFNEKDNVDFELTASSSSFC